MNRIKRFYKKVNIIEHPSSDEYDNKIIDINEKLSL
jgi:hypothetical protein